MTYSIVKFVAQDIPTAYDKQRQAIGIETTEEYDSYEECIAALNALSVEMGTNFDARKTNKFAGEFWTSFKMYDNSGKLQHFIDNRHPRIAL